MTLITEVGDDAGSETGFGHIALQLIGYGFAVRSVQHRELADSTKVGWGGGTIDAAVSEVVSRIGRESQLVGKVCIASEGLV